MRVRCHVRVGACNGDVFTERLVHCHMVLPGRNNPRQHGNHGNQKKENGVSGGKLELAHDVLLNPAHPAARRAVISRRVSPP